MKNDLVKKILTRALGAAASAVLMLCAAACSAVPAGQPGNPGESTESTAASPAGAAPAASSYTQITQETAGEMMLRDDGHIVLDVRRPDEYVSGHIPGAVCLPNENIGTEMPAELPDPDQVILVYCRTGRRSKEASQKLADIGYSNVYEFGGIQDWTGETVTGEEPYQDAIAEAIRPMPILVMTVNGKTFYPKLEENSSAEALMEKLNSGELEVSLHDYGNFEKVGPLPWDLPRNDTQITTKPGDIILYQGNQITVYYDENTWSFTKLGEIPDVSKEDLLEVFGSGNVDMTMHIEWTE